MRHKIGNHIIDVSMDAIDVATIRAKTPVITGRLRDGFELTSDGNIINEVPYAALVEWGTVKMAGRFMVERSVDEIARRLRKKIIEQINRPGLITLPDIRIRLR